jgi:hypothetical protein
VLPAHCHKHNDLLEHQRHAFFGTIRGDTPFNATTGVMRLRQTAGTISFGVAPCALP